MAKKRVLPPDKKDDEELLQQSIQPQPQMQQPMQPMQPMQPQMAQQPPMSMALASMQQAPAAPKIGKEQISKAREILGKYKAAKEPVNTRVIENEEWYKRRHWNYIRGAKPNPTDPEPASAWMFNVLMNKHADAMDNYPMPNVLPREEQDKKDAETIGDIMPVVLEYNHYETTYSLKQWSKLKNGNAVTGVFWNKSLYNGLGDIEVRKIDILNFYSEPGVSELQRSRNVFLVSAIDDDLLKEMYPDKLQNVALGNPDDVKDYIHDATIPKEHKSPVVDWYYKKMVGTKAVLHYVKFVADICLYASEDDPACAQRGFYDHGLYPFVVDVQFPLENELFGFGLMDICKSPQIYIDKLDQSILKSAVAAARRRYIVKGDGKINVEEFAQANVDIIHYNGAGDPKDSVFPVDQPSVDAVAENIRLNKVDEMKETTGNRDFSQGGTAAGVTAYAAIAALAESGSKTSRDGNKGSYRSYEEECNLITELFRQFYTDDRTFRVTGKMGEMSFRKFNNQNIARYTTDQNGQVVESGRVPIFDIKVVPQKSSPFSTVAQNERAKDFYQMGFFQPQNADQALAALDMMDFDGIDAVRKRISENGTLLQLAQQLLPLTLYMAALLPPAFQQQYMPMLEQIVMKYAPLLGADAAMQGMDGGIPGEMITNQLGASFRQSGAQTGDAARAKVAAQAAPKS